jgi:RNA polymerase sigma-70 factor (ECF subfamily)
MLPNLARQADDGWLLDTLCAARAGCEGALGDLIEAFRPYLLLIADSEGGAVPRSKEAPSDLVGSAVRKAVGDFGQFRGQTVKELACWLRGILLHHISDVGRRYRTDKRHIGREVSLDRGGHGHNLRDELPSRDPAPDQSVICREDGQRVRAALERLPGHYAQVIVLRERDGLSFEEVGRRLGRSAESARKLFERALKQLRDALGATDAA